MRQMHHRSDKLDDEQNTKLQSMTFAYPSVLK